MSLYLVGSESAPQKRAKTGYSWLRRIRLKAINEQLKIVRASVKKQDYEKALLFTKSLHAHIKELDQLTSTDAA